MVAGSDHLPWFGDSRPLVNETARFLTGERPAGGGERRLATVMFTDIADSTARAASLGDARWAELLEQHNLLIRDELDQHGGREVKNTGDGFVALFDSPARGIECGRAAASEVRDLAIELRTGLHTGEIEVLANGDVGGMGVHIAARVMALAQPGEVMVSSTVRELVVGSGIRFQPRGSHQLKGVPGSWRLFAVDAPTTRVEIDLSEDRTVHTTDRISLFLARTVPGALRGLAALGHRTG